jgi:hypothetical protein
MVQLIERHDSIQKHSYIEANQRFIRCEKHLNILPLFGRLRRIFHNLSSLLLDMKHTHTTQKESLKQRGWERDPPHNSPMSLFIAKTKRLECPYGPKGKLQLIKGSLV